MFKHKETMSQQEFVEMMNEEDKKEYIEVDYDNAWFGHDGIALCSHDCQCIRCEEFVNLK